MTIRTKEEMLADVAQLREQLRGRMIVDVATEDILGWVTPVGVKLDDGSTLWSCSANGGDPYLEREEPA